MIFAVCDQIMEEVNYAFAVSEFTETIDSARVFLKS